MGGRGVPAITAATVAASASVAVSPATRLGSELEAESLHDTLSTASSLSPDDEPQEQELHPALALALSLSRKSADARRSGETTGSSLPRRLAALAAPSASKAPALACASFSFREAAELELTTFYGPTDASSGFVQMSIDSWSLAHKVCALRSCIFPEVRSHSHASCSRSASRQRVPRTHIVACICRFQSPNNRSSCVVGTEFWPRRRTRPTSSST